VEAKGFQPDEIGMHPPKDAFMNIEIFRSLHYASLVVVDLTGVRPNCTMELGYALARRRRVVISAREGTRLPFDSDKLPTFSWNSETSSKQEVGRYLAWFDRHVDLPPVVEQNWY